MFKPSAYQLAYWGLTSTTWLVLWSILGAITLLLVILLRTRWSGARPWRKCAILSLWVHVLLAFAATTVHIMSGAPETGSDQPIRVSVTTVVEQSEPIDEILPDWQQPTETSLVAPEPEELLPPEPEPQESSPDEAAVEQLVVTQAEPVSSEPAPPLEAPSLLASP
ncbi:MAG: hypothetical protein KDA51_18265, partial [Planctomycetales bacterium]|nr:hypothetical protein [Planctomycetales bacterium]